MNGEALRILLVEDDPDHAELVVDSLAEHGICNQIYHVSDGEAALDYLFRRGQYADPEKSPVPHVVLLDLRLPKVDGIDVLKEIKATPSLLSIPIVVLTTSEAEKDVVAAYHNHVNSYLVKPVDFSEFVKLIHDLGFYWLAWNRTP
jgi:CheY-like chemotaxis protein